MKGTALAIWLAIATAAHAQTTRLVPSQYATIQEAILASVDGDTVLVSPGLRFETIDFLGRGITVRSAEGPLSTILDGGFLPVPVVQFVNGEPPTAVLSGFTIQNGVAGAIHILNGSSPLITGNRIRENSDCTEGAGIDVFTATPRIVGNAIESNFQPNWCWGGGGGGIFLWGDCEGAQIVGNVVTGNSHTSGGGIWVVSPGEVLVEGNVVQGNAAAGPVPYIGGGIYAAGKIRLVQNLVTGNASPVAGGGIAIDVGYGSGIAIVNNTVAWNDSPFGSAFFTNDDLDSIGTIANNVFHSGAGQAAFHAPSWNPFFFLLRNNDVWSTGGPAYGGGIADPTGTWGNVSVDPLFANPLVGDFHLPPSSPCVDAGFQGAPHLPPADPDGSPRSLDGDGDGSALVDIGWDEFDPAAPFGAGCPGSGGLVPLVGANGSPAVGNGAFALTLSDALGGSTAALLWGLLPFPIPVPLASLGLPACSLLVPPSVLSVVPVAGTGAGGGTATLPLPIPNDPLLQGAHVYFQWYVIDPGPGVLPGAMSAGLDVTLL